MTPISKLKLVLMLCWTLVQTRVPATWSKDKQLSIHSKDIQLFLIINKDHVSEHQLPN